MKKLYVYYDEQFEQYKKDREKEGIKIISIPKISKVQEDKRLLNGEIERDLTTLGMALQNRMLFKCIMQLNDLAEEEKKVIEPFLHNDKVLFYGTEKYTMEKLYRLFVAKGVLKNASDNEMILTGVGQKGKRKLPRTLGRLLNSNFAKEEILPEYLELLKNFFIELNIRNCIMHGLGETFDYLDIGLVSIMFQLLWDIADCEIFKD